MYSIEKFKNLNKLESMVITHHSRKRFAEREISIDEVINTIQTGEIIEEYADDFPFPSCLILGESGRKKQHIVASLNEDMIYVITAYIPDLSKWEDDLKTRKENDRT